MEEVIRISYYCCRCCGGDCWGCWAGGCWAGAAAARRAGCRTGPARNRVAAAGAGRAGAAAARSPSAATAARAAAGRPAVPRTVGLLRRLLLRHLLRQPGLVGLLGPGVHRRLPCFVHREVPQQQDDEGAGHQDTDCEGRQLQPALDGRGEVLGLPVVEERTRQAAHPVVALDGGAADDDAPPEGVPAQDQQSARHVDDTPVEVERLCGSGAVARAVVHDALEEVGDADLPEAVVQGPQEQDARPAHGHEGGHTVGAWR